MFESHRPFIRAVLERTSKFSENDLSDFLSGKLENHDLAAAFEAWSRGDSQGITTALLGRDTLVAPKDTNKTQ